MAYNPVPFVVLDGQELNTRLTAPEAVVVLDGVQFRWGRSDLLAQPSAGVANVQLLDRSPLPTATSDYEGLSLAIGYRIDGQPGEWIAFRGKITASDIEARPLDPDTGQPRGWIISLTAADALQALADRFIGDAPWPQEPSEARAARLAAACSDILAGITVRAGITQAPIDVDNRSALDLLTQLVAGTAEILIYNPNDNVMTTAGRFNFGAAASPLSLGPVAPHGVTIYPSFNSSHPLPGRQIRADGAVTRDTAQAITEIRATYQEADWNGSIPGYENYRDVTEVVKTGVDESRFGRRVFSISTHNFRGSIGANRYLDWIALEGSMAYPPSFTWDTSRNGGFESLTQINTLLLGFQTPRMVFIAGSVYNQWLGAARSAFGIMSATIAYADESWTVSGTPLPAWFHGETVPITWADATTDTPWTDFNEAVTWADLDLVGRILV